MSEDHNSTDFLLFIIILILIFGVGTVVSWVTTVFWVGFFVVSLLLIIVGISYLISNYKCLSDKDLYRDNDIKNYEIRSKIRFVTAQIQDLKNEEKWLKSYDFIIWLFIASLVLFMPNGFASLYISALFSEWLGYNKDWIIGDGFIYIIGLTILFTLVEIVFLVIKFIKYKARRINLINELIKSNMKEIHQLNASFK